LLVSDPKPPPKIRISDAFLLLDFARIRNDSVIADILLTVCDRLDETGHDADAKTLRDQLAEITANSWLYQ